MVLKRVALGDTPVVPALWISEFTNVMAKAVQTDIISPDTAEEIILHAGTLPIQTQSSPSLIDLYSIVKRYRISAYDATYLELSMRMNIPLATTDRQLAKTAKDLGLHLR